MIQRCTNPKNTDYEHYGKKGISVCPEWLDFQNFFEWAVNHGYKDNLTIDRIDSEGNYMPENCQWITHKENSDKARAKRYKH